MSAFGITLERWQWLELKEMIDKMQHKGSTVGLARFIEGGIHFQALKPLDDKKS